MINVMTINGYQAVINYDPDIRMFRGEFIGLDVKTMRTQAGFFMPARRA